jgi:hypothetical protein
MKQSSLHFWQTIFIIGMALSAVAFYQVVQQSNVLGIAVFHSKWVLLLIFYVLSFGTCGILLYRLRDERVKVWLSSLEVEKSPGWLWQVSGGLIILLSIGAVYFLRFIIFRGFIPQPMPSIWLMWWLGLFAAVLLKIGTRRPLVTLFALTLLVQGVFFAAADYLPQISTYPFSLGWSEASRYYYGSLIFARRIYGQFIPLSFLHPTRYFMQSLPFFVDGLPVWVHRLWQVILWLGGSALTGILLARRLKLASRFKSGLVAMWFALLMLYVGVYYHLQVMVWIILLGVSPKHPWRSFAAVVLASVWAGMSRVNWFPVPAMLALTLYFLEEPVKGYRNFWQYLLKPLLWSVVGIMAALASQSFYIFWSGNGNNAAAFGSSFTSDLIWERLWPNPTYPPGIVQATVFVALPLIAVVVWGLWGRIRAWHPVRLLGLGGMLLVLCAGGLVVSVKIGGGGDLHNMDAFMTLLGIVALYLFFDVAKLEILATPYKSSTGLALFAIVIIISAFMPVKPKLVQTDSAVAWQDIQKIQQMATQAVSDGHEVLFINQRHLLAEGVIKGIPLVPEYEVLALMEMAMSGNQVYLDQFYKDLENHRFAFIVVSGLYTGRQADDYPFAAENNAWSERISNPLLCQYEVKTIFPGDVVILTPREMPACP